MKNCICHIGFKGARALAGRISLLLLLAGAVLWPGQTLHAATRQWTGNDSGLWSDPDNWFPVGVPRNGDSLTFPAIGPLDATSMVNDLTGLTVGTITFTAGGYALNGNALTLIQGITDNHSSGGLNIVRCNIQFSGVRGRFNSLGTGLLEINGTTTLVDAQELIITPVVTNLTVSGAIVGNGSLVKRDDGTLYLRGSANNTYSGATRVEGGRLRLAKTSGARAISANVTIDGDFIGNASLSDDLPGQYPPVLSMVITNGGGWFVTNGATVTNFFIGDNCYLYGDGLLSLECDVTAEGYCSMYCPVSLGNQSRTFRVRSVSFDDGLAIYNHIIGAIGANSAGLIKSGSGRLYLAAPNTYVGLTILQGGELVVGSDTALGSTALGGETRLRGGTLKFAGGSLTCQEPIVVESFSGIGFSGTNVLTGPLTLNDTCGFWGDRNSDFLEIRGTISGSGGQPDSYGPGGLQVWSGIVRLAGTAPNTYGGGTLVSARGLGWEGVLELAKPDNVMAAPGQVYVRGFGTPPGNAFLRQLQTDGVANVAIGLSGAWLLNGHGVSPAALGFRGEGYVDTEGGVLFLLNQGTNQLHAMMTDNLISNYTAQIRGLLVCSAQTNDIVTEVGATLDVQAQIVGPFTIAKEGAGTLRLSSSNNIHGPLLVNEGTLLAAHNDAFGATTAGTFVNNHASLALEGGLEIAGETLTLDTTNAASLLSLGPVTNTWSGNIVLQRTAGIRVADPLGAFTHFGGVGTFDGASISGPGGFTKSGPGRFFITGLFGGNNYTGPTTVTEGTLEALRSGPNLSSNIVVTGANAVLRTGRNGTIFTAARTVLPTGANVSIEDGALWAMNGTNFETISRLTGDGHLSVSTAGALAISNTVSCEFSGQLSGTGALNKLGIATLQLTGNSPGYTGAATVLDGTYKVDGQVLNSPVTVRPGAILRGGGAIGDVTAFESGAVVLVDSTTPGRLGGALNVGNLTMLSGGVSGASLGFEFFGPSATGGDDRLIARGGVDITSTRVSLDVNYAPREGDVFTVLQKDSAGPITGTFALWPEGIVREQGGYPLRATYLGGDGNDFTLTVTNLPLGGGAAEIVSGNGGNVLMPDDCGRLTLIVTNRGAVALTGLRAQLRSLTEGVTVTRAESDYPNLSPNARGSNATPFQIRTEPSFACGAGAEFELVLSASNQPPFAIRYTLLGTSGFGLEFDGRNDQVEIPANTFAGVVNNFTIELWAKPAGNRTETGETNSGVSGVSVPLRQLQRFAVFPDRGNLAYGATHVSAGLSIGRNGISAYEQGTNTGLSALHLPSRLVYSNDVSGWTHVALVYANRAPRLYVNGALVRSGAATPFPNVHPSGSLGGSPQASYGNFDGQLDEVRIWNVALNQSQIQSNMMRSLSGAEPGLLTYFRCDDATGGVLADSAPAAPNRNGALVNGAAFALPGVTPFGDVNCDSGGGACESCFAVNGRFDTNAIQSARRLTATGLPSICDPAKPCPGFDEFPDEPVRHVTHHFTNQTESEICVTAQLRPECAIGVGEMSAAAYLGEFRVNQPCTSFLGDDGAGAAIPSPFSFRVPPRTNFLIVVTARTTNLVCDSYALELFGLPCPPPVLSIAKDSSPGHVLLHWSSAYPDFHLQLADSFTSPGPVGFGDVATPPVLSGGKFVVTNSAAAAQQFFQLKK